MTTPMTKEALAELRIPKRKSQNWSSAVMRNCDFCSQWALTVHHEDGGCICASCCDGEYTTALRSALEMAIEHAKAKDKRIAELELSESQLIEERDIAENAMGKAYEAVTEFPPEWSNWFGFADAVEEIGEICEQWRKQVVHISELQSRAESAEQRVAELIKDNEYIRNRFKELDLMFGKNLLVMQAAIIEWQGTGNAKSGLAWIYNTLFGPGELPDESENDAQAYFDRKHAPLDEELMKLHKWFWEQSETELAKKGVE